MQAPSGNIIAVNGVMAHPVVDAGRGALTTRLLSAAVLAPPVLAAVYAGPPYFSILVAIGVLVMAWEWSRLFGAGKLFWPAGRFLWLAGGFLYIGVPALALIWLRADEDFGRGTVFWLLALVWATDCGAYVFGRWIGGLRLAPALSPNKTWAGLIGGVACAGATGSATAMVLGQGGVLTLGALSAVLGVVEQAGDLLESWIKRRCGVKDAGNLIPGHGGLLDRVDGLLAVALTVALISLAGDGSILRWL